MRRDPVPNLSPFWLKNGQKDSSFLRSYVFGLLTSKMTWYAQQCPIFLFLWFFCQGTRFASNFHFKYIFRSFCHFVHLSLGFFIVFQIFLPSEFISMPQVFEQSLFLFLPVCSLLQFSASLPKAKVIARLLHHVSLRPWFSPSSPLREKKSFPWAKALVRRKSVKRYACSKSFCCLFLVRPSYKRCLKC